jgi:hypothetical protein
MRCSATTWALIGWLYINLETSAFCLIESICPSYSEEVQTQMGKDKGLGKAFIPDLALYSPVLRERVGIVGRRGILYKSRQNIIVVFYILSAGFFYPKTSKFCTRTQHITPEHFISH